MPSGNVLKIVRNIEHHKPDPIESTIDFFSGDKYEYRHDLARRLTWLQTILSVVSIGNALKIVRNIEHHKPKTS